MFCAELSEILGKDKKNNKQQQLITSHPLDENKRKESNGIFKKILATSADRIALKKKIGVTKKKKSEVRAIATDQDRHIDNVRQ